MRVLIACHNADLAQVWAAHLGRRDAEATVATDRDGAIDALSADAFDVIVLNTGIGESDASAVADYAAYRHPGTKVIFVTNSTFFSNQAIFTLFPNACAWLSESTMPEDLAELVSYHAGGGR